MTFGEVLGVGNDNLFTIFIHNHDYMFYSDPRGKIWACKPGAKSYTACHASVLYELLENKHLIKEVIRE